MCCVDMSQGDFVRMWVPELKNIPGGSVHIVWTLSRGALERAGVTLGETYPSPVIVAPEWSRHYSKSSVSLIIHKCCPSFYY